MTPLKLLEKQMGDAGIEEFDVDNFNRLRFRVFTAFNQWGYSYLVLLQTILEAGKADEEVTGHLINEVKEIQRKNAIVTEFMMLGI